MFPDTVLKISLAMRLDFEQEEKINLLAQSHFVITSTYINIIVPLFRFYIFSVSVSDVKSDYS